MDSSSSSSSPPPALTERRERAKWFAAKRQKRYRRTHRLVEISQPQPAPSPSPAASDLHPSSPPLVAAVAVPYHPEEFEADEPMPDSPLHRPAAEEVAVAAPAAPPSTFNPPSPSSSPPAVRTSTGGDEPLCASRKRAATTPPRPPSRRFRQAPQQDAPITTHTSSPSLSTTAAPAGAEPPELFGIASACSQPSAASPSAATAPVAAPSSTSPAEDFFIAAPSPSPPSASAGGASIPIGSPAALIGSLLSSLRGFSEDVQIISLQLALHAAQAMQLRDESRIADLCVANPTSSAGCLGAAAPSPSPALSSAPAPPPSPPAGNRNSSAVAPGSDDSPSSPGSGPVPVSSPAPASPASIAGEPAPASPASIAGEPAPASPASIAAEPAPASPASVAGSPAPAAALSPPVFRQDSPRVLPSSASESGVMGQLLPLPEQAPAAAESNPDVPLFRAVPPLRRGNRVRLRRIHSLPGESLPAPRGAEPSTQGGGEGQSTEFVNSEECGFCYDTVVDGPEAYTCSLTCEGSSVVCKRKYHRACVKGSLEAFLESPCSNFMGIDVFCTCSRVPHCVKCQQPFGADFGRAFFPHHRRLFTLDQCDSSCGSQHKCLLSVAHCDKASVLRHARRQAPSLTAPSSSSSAPPVPAPAPALLPPSLPPAAADVAAYSTRRSAPSVAQGPPFTGLAASAFHPDTGQRLGPPEWDSRFDNISVGARWCRFPVPRPCHNLDLTSFNNGWHPRDFDNRNTSLHKLLLACEGNDLVIRRGDYSDVTFSKPCLMARWRIRKGTPITFFAGPRFDPAVHVRRVRLNALLDFGIPESLLALPRTHLAVYAMTTLEAKEVNAIRKEVTFGNNLLTATYLMAKKDIDVGSDIVFHDYELNSLDRLPRP